MVPSDYMFPCVSKTFFGLDCFGCGAQRAVVLLLEGKFFEAFCMYPAIYPLGLLVIFCFLNKKIKCKHSDLIIPFLISISLIFMVLGYISKFI